METKHTKGEWKVNRLLPNLIEDKVNKVIARALREEQSPQNWEENEANAKLIAAAPKMLEALSYCKQILKEVSTQNCWKGEKENLVNVAANKAEAAINKATA